MLTQFEKPDGTRFLVVEGVIEVAALFYKSAEGVSKYYRIHLTTTIHCLAFCPVLE